MTITEWLRINPVASLACALVLLHGADAGADATRHNRDPATGAETWEWRGEGVALSLTQILPDQVRGFYGARGFDANTVEAIARHCAFQTVMRNESAADEVAPQLADWRFITAPGERPLKLNRDWQAEWDRRGIAPATRLAFQWAQFPPDQSFAHGDWNMGMTLYPLARGSRFDLRFVWKVNDVTHAGLMRGVRCAADGAKR